MTYHFWEREGERKKGENLRERKEEEESHVHEKVGQRFGGHTDPEGSHPWNPHDSEW